MKTKTLTPLSPRLDSRLLAYTALATAALAAPAVPTASAVIVYSGPTNINIPSTTAGIYLNVVTGMTGSSSASLAGWDVNPYGSTNLTMFNPAAPAGGVYVGATGFFNLTLGTLINAASTFSSGNISATSPNPLNFNSSNNLIGFRFQNEAAGNAIMYGWMRISLTGTATSQPRAIVEYAYENTGGAIAAGAVPEPSTFALLGVMAVGALGVRAWRGRKAA